MTDVFVDTNVFIALVNSRDQLHERAVADLSKLSRYRLVTTGAVLSESAFALARPDQRARLVAFLDRLPVLPVVYDNETETRSRVFKWLAQYAEHSPDYADAELCVLAGRKPGTRIWTYDSEFKHVWRGANGRRPRLIGA